MIVWIWIADVYSAEWLSTTEIWKWILTLEVTWGTTRRLNVLLSVQSSLSIFAHKYLRKCEGTYSIVQSEYSTNLVLLKLVLYSDWLNLSYKDSFIKIVLEQSYQRNLEMIVSCVLSGKVTSSSKKSLGNVKYIWYNHFE